MQNGNRVIMLRFGVKVYDQTGKANLPETLFYVRFHFKSKKALLPPAPRFSCFFSSFCLFWLGFCQAAFLQEKFLPNSSKPASSEMTSSYSWHHPVKLWTKPLIMIRNFWYEFSVFLCCFFFSWRVCFPIHIMLNLKDHQYLVCMVRAEEIERILTRWLNHFLAYNLYQLFMRLWRRPNKMWVGNTAREGWGQVGERKGAHFSSGPFFST